MRLELGAGKMGSCQVVSIQRRRSEWVQWNDISTINHFLHEASKRKGCETESVPAK